MTDNDYLYSTWKAMHRRCYDTTYHSYHRYGGRGIRVCERWHDYQLYKLDVAGDWFRGATMDRQDNDGNYERDNCVWAAKGTNTKANLVDPVYLLNLYESGYLQKDLAEMFGTDQPHISRILARGRKRAYS